MMKVEITYHKEMTSPEGKDYVGFAFSKSDDIVKLEIEPYDQGYSSVFAVHKNGEQFISNMVVGIIIEE